MGSAGSKNSDENKRSSENIHPGSVPTTPILTPEHRKKITALDPRSPNAHLSRTPLQLLSATTEQIEDISDGELYELDGQIRVKSKTVLLELDPRSPTTEFKRTPIVINVDSESDVPKKIRNKNLDKVRRSTILTTPKSTIEKSTSNIVPPKLLESSPIKPKSEINKRKSFIGLLETNIDFTETDLDEVLREKCKLKDNSQNNFITPSARKSVVVNENIDPRSPSTDFIRTPIQIKKENCIEKKYSKVNCKLKPKQIVESQDDIMDKIEIEKMVQEICGIIHLENETLNAGSTDDISFESMESGEEADLETEDKISRARDLNTVMEAKSAPVSPPTHKQVNITEQQNSVLSESPTPKQSKSAPVTPPVVNITADVNELDKKLSNLIYQDEDIVVCPRIVKLKDNSNRSPLRNCNGTENDRRKSMPKLKVSDKPRKSEYIVSKIPVFKEKEKNQVDCENTPPRNAAKRKMIGKKSQWDNADKTLII